MKLISWNVNGLRACVQKGFLDFFREADADIFCIQETKLQEGQISLELEGYDQYWNYAVKKGYSGTAVFTKRKPLHVAYGLGIEEHDREGRVITLEYPGFYLVTGLNLPLLIALLTSPEADTVRLIQESLEEMKNQIVFCNELKAEEENEDF